ncbi:MAG: contractile injection system protein, VgrG/Pvc8 family [Oscillospiraceae bacterium]|nr:contractile injection system protein, VgrG/Pvc8 family [Oscillospiraceae bacterium]
MIHIFTTIEYSNIRIQGDYDRVSIRNIKITERLNDHSRLILTGVIPNEDKDSYATNVSGYGKIKLLHMPSGEPSNAVVIFSGLVEQVTVTRVHDVYTVELECVSHTYLLDISVNNESFQDRNMRFGAAVGRVLSKYNNNALYSYHHDSENDQLRRFILQFNETDWQFIKRIASMNNTFLLPDSSSDSSAFWIGLPQDRIEQPIGNVFHSTEKDFERVRNILANELIPGAVEDDFLQTKISSDNLYLNLGDRVLFMGEHLAVSAKESELSSKEAFMEHTYTLSTIRGTMFEFLYNENLQGNSISGIVIDTKKDFTKLHLAIDKTQDVENATWFIQPAFYSVGDEKGWRAMPELGDKLWLHFPTKKEWDCYIISSSGADFDRIMSFMTVPKIDPASGKSRQVPATTGGTMNKNKILEYSGQKLQLNDEGILLSSQGNTYIHLTDGGGITISSDDDITFEGENIIIGTSGEHETEEISIDADVAVEILCQASSIIVDGAAGEAHFSAPKIDLSSPLNIARVLPTDEEVAKMIAEIEKLNAFLEAIDDLDVDFPAWFRGDLIDCFRNRSSDSEIADLIAIAGRVTIENMVLGGVNRDAIVYTSPDGVTYVYPVDYAEGANRINLIKALGVFDQLPDSLKVNINSIQFMDVRNPDDPYWAKEYKKPDFTSAATGGGGNVTFWEPGQSSSNNDTLLNYMRHEAGHNLDLALGGGQWFSDTQDWQDRMSDDFDHINRESPTDYGKNSAHEDFAESVTEYLKDPIAFKRDFPNRTEYLEGVL